MVTINNSMGSRYVRRDTTVCVWYCKMLSSLKMLVLVLFDTYCSFFYTDNDFLYVIYKYEGIYLFVVL